MTSDQELYIKNKERCAKCKKSCKMAVSGLMCYENTEYKGNKK